MIGADFVDAPTSYCTSCHYPLADDGDGTVVAMMLLRMDVHDAAAVALDEEEFVWVNVECSWMMEEIDPPVVVVDMVAVLIAMMLEYYCDHYCY